LLQADSTPSNLLFGPEKVKGFEVGYKADLLANTLRLDLTAYRYNYNGLQVTALETVTYRYSIRNAARARTTGVQGSFQWIATDSLTFDGNIGYNRARYLSFPNAQCWTGQTAAQGCIGGAQDLTGKALNRAPDVTFKLGADYRMNVASDYVADLSVSAAYSSSFETAADYSPGGPQSAYWLVNAAVHFGPEDEKYRFSLIGRNLTNSFYKIFSLTKGLGSPYQFLGFFNRPREVVLQVGYNF
jgi:outer membrane receptor protein involved in Fe transport